VSSIDFLLSYGLAPLGLALIAPAFGAGPVLLACAVVCLVAPTAAMLVPGTRTFSRRPRPS
jgi:hypothetical protein